MFMLLSVSQEEKRFVDGTHMQWCGRDYKGLRRLVCKGI